MSRDAVELAFGRLMELNLRKVGTNMGTLKQAGTVEIQQSLGFQCARVAKSADATDLKSVFPQGECGFNSRPGHQNILFKISSLYNLWI